MHNSASVRMPVESLRKGLELLEQISSDLSGRGLSLACLSKRMGLKRTTAHNLLKTLSLCGYVLNDGNGCYRLGWKLQRLQRERTLSHFSYASASRVLAYLAAETGESLVFAALVNNSRRVIARASGRQDVQVNTVQLESSGSNFWHTVTGRILAAYCLPEELSLIVSNEGYPGRVWQNISERHFLDDALLRVRQAGQATDLSGEVYSVAVPVLSCQQLLLGALGIHLPQFRRVSARDAELLALLKSAAADLALDLGLAAEAESIKPLLNDMA